MHAGPLPKCEMGARALVPARLRRTDGAQPPLPHCTPALCPARAGSAGPAPLLAQVRWRCHFVHDVTSEEIFRAWGPLSPSKAPPHTESSSWSLGGGGLFPLKKTPSPHLGAQTLAGRPAPAARQPSALRGLGARARSLPGSGTRTVPSRSPPPLHAGPLPRVGWERRPRSFCTWGYLRRDL